MREEWTDAMDFEALFPLLVFIVIIASVFRGLAEKFREARSSTESPESPAPQGKELERRLAELLGLEEEEVEQASPEQSEKQPPAHAGPARSTIPGAPPEPRRPQPGQIPADRPDRERAPSFRTVAGAEHTQEPGAPRREQVQQPAWRAAAPRAVEAGAKPIMPRPLLSRRSTTSRRSGRSKVTQRLQFNRKKLAEAIVYMEILGTPVALRDRPPGRT